MTKLRLLIGAERGRGAREARIDSRDIRKNQQERERKSGNDERDQHARVVVSQSDRSIVEVEELEELREPTLGTEIRQHAFCDQYGPQRDRHYEDRRHP